MKYKLSTLLLTVLTICTQSVCGQGEFSHAARNARALTSSSETQLIAQEKGPDASSDDETVQTRVPADGMIIQQGGPYHSTGDTVQQQFVSLLTLTAKDCAGRLMLTFFNGPNKEPKFRWVRVYLNNQAAVTNLKPGAKPVGTLVLSERSFVPNANKVQLDWSRRLQPGHYALLIIGAGPAGASVKWRLNAPTGNSSSTSAAPASASPVSASTYGGASTSRKSSAAAGGVRITSLQPTSAVAGGTLQLNGSGFTPARDQNSVYLNQTGCRVTEATQTQLQVEIPSTISPGTYSAQVTVDGAKSNTMTLKIAGRAEMTNSNLHAGPSDTTMVISGNGFSQVPGDNEVTFGSTKASVLSATPTELTVKVPYFAEAEGSPFFLMPKEMEINLKVKGIPAKGHLTFYSSKTQW